MYPGVLKSVKSAGWWWWKVVIPHLQPDLSLFVSFDRSARTRRPCQIDVIADLEYPQYIGPFESLPRPILNRAQSQDSGLYIEELRLMFIIFMSDLFI